MLYQAVAHRGNCEFAIENTKESIVAALESGITHIEIDVQLSKDSTVILFHDNDLIRMTGLPHPIGNLYFDELSKLSLTPPKSLSCNAKSANITTLDEVVSLLKNYPEVTLFVEVKKINFRFHSYQHVCQTINALLENVPFNAVVISFSYRFLRCIQTHSTLTIGYVLPSWSAFNDKLIRILKPKYIYSDYVIVPPSFHFSNTQFIWVLYDIPSTTLAKEFIKRGVCYFETFSPEKLKTGLSE